MHSLIACPCWYCTYCLDSSFVYENKTYACNYGCRKRRLINEYELSYTTGSLRAGPSCLRSVWVGTAGHWQRTVPCTPSAHTFRKTTNAPSKYKITNFLHADWAIIAFTKSEESSFMSNSNVWQGHNFHRRDKIFFNVCNYMLFHNI